MREDFTRVVLRFEDGEFNKPEWRHYPITPHAIQSACFDLARGVTQAGGAMPAAILDQRGIQS